MSDNKHMKLIKALMGPAMMRPFLPTERRPNPDGSYSTEISMTAQDPQSGQWMNFPSLWMGPQGPTQYHNEDQALAEALRYEQFGYQFPRFSTLDEADKAAIIRSHQGGAITPLAKVRR